MGIDPSDRFNEPALVIGEVASRASPLRVQRVDVWIQAPKPFLDRSKPDHLRIDGEMPSDPFANVARGRDDLSGLELGYISPPTVKRDVELALRPVAPLTPFSKARAEGTVSRVHTPG